MKGGDERQRLRTLLEENRLVVCVGSGGVGKTTTGACLGLYGAQLGKRTLVITIDPAKRLANALGLDALSHEPAEVSTDVLAEAGLTLKAPLHAMMLDLHTAWDDMIRRLSPSSTDVDRILENRFYLHLTRELPGAHEFIACETLHTLAEEGDYDLIVLDTPPTTNALDFLDAPNRILSFLDHEAFQLFLQQKEGRAAKLSLFFLDGASSAVQSIMARFTGKAFLEQMAEFLLLFRDLYAAVTERTRAFQAMLRGPQAAFVIITSPQPGPVKEARFFHQELAERKFPVGAFIANRIMPTPPRELLALDEAALAQRLIAESMSDEDARLVSQALVAAAQAQERVARRDLAALAHSLDDLESEVPIIRVPRLPGDVHNTQGLARLLPLLVGAP
jgi:anion-transporting  ArsA/GET3 family ATPase